MTMMMTVMMTTMTIHYVRDDDDAQCQNHCTHASQCASHSRHELVCFHRLQSLDGCVRAFLTVHVHQPDRSHAP